MREKEDCQKGEALCTKREDICLKLYCSFICHIREIEQHSHFVFSILNTSCTLSHFCDLSLSGNPGIYHLRPFPPGQHIKQFKCLENIS